MLLGIISLLKIASLYHVYFLEFFKTGDAAMLLLRRKFLDNYDFLYVPQFANLIQSLRYVISVVGT